MTESVDHQIGRISGRMDALDQNFKGLEMRIENRLNHLDANVKVIHDAVTAAGGSWRTLVWLGAAVTALATILASVLHWITGK
jgi:actin-related protein